MIRYFFAIKLQNLNAILLLFCSVIDNRTIKRELIQGSKYETPEQAKAEIFKYIELYYNTSWIQSALGYLSPAQFEEQNS
jgi:transposase InsO family protein